MQFLLSPAKRLSFGSPLPAATLAAVSSSTPPSLLEHTTVLAKQLKATSATKLQQLMRLSPALAELNHQRFQTFSRHFTKENSRPAIFAFKGEVYQGLDIDRYTAKELKRLQEKLFILSGFYGVLRPLDAMQPYRLEMGTPLKTERGKDLYAFWGSRIAETINAQLKKNEEVVNLASAEYFKAVKPFLSAPVLTPIFKDEVKGSYKVVSFWAKRARGLMVSYAIKNQAKTPAALKDFTAEGYRFDEARSTENEYLFLRNHPAA